jgi:hypothetical protein
MKLKAGLMLQLLLLLLGTYAASNGDISACFLA